MYNEFIELDEYDFLCKGLSITGLIVLGEQLKKCDKGYNCRGCLILSKSTDYPSLERMIYFYSK